MNTNARKHEEKESSGIRLKKRRMELEKRNPISKKRATSSFNFFRVCTFADNDGWTATTRRRLLRLTRFLISDNNVLMKTEKKGKGEAIRRLALWMQIC